MNFSGILNLKIFKNTYFQAATLIIICFAAFLFMHSTPFLSDPDSFYHIKISQMMADGGIVKNFPYLQFTILKTNFVDHHLLYHAYLIPFVKFISLASPGQVGPIWGAKIGHLILDCLVFLAVFIFLKKFKIKYALLLSLLMFLTPAFIFRMLLIKAQPFSIILILFSTYFIIKRRYIPLSITCFVYVWAYGGWFLALIMAALYIITESIDKISQTENIRYNLKSILAIFFRNCFRKDNVKLMSAAIIGLALGLVINPYFPRNLYFYFVQIIQIGLVNKKNLGVGAEWFPFGIKDFFINILAPMAVLALPIIFHLNYWKKINLKSKFLFLASIFFMLATIKAKRSIEYFVPFAILAAGLTFQSAFGDDKIKKDCQIILDKIKPFLNLKIIMAVAVIAFTLSGIAVVVRVREQSKVYPLNSLEKSAKWLSENSAEDETIFNLRWDRFPMLFYYDDKNYYVSGLDPTFTYALDKKIWQYTSDMLQGKIDGDTPEVIKNTFGARYIIATKLDKKFISAVSTTPAFEKVYDDDEAIIYKMK